MVLPSQSILEISMEFHSISTVDFINRDKIINYIQLLQLGHFKVKYWFSKTDIRPSKSKQNRVCLCRGY